jgi:UDP-2,3-diacylglucosamine pyrophosphatase LpxH
MDATSTVKTYRTLFISDVHLGTPDSQAAMLVDFLREHQAETIYLVGDIIDCWRMKRKGFYWPQAHNDVVQKLLRQARKGARIIYIPGNHDEMLRAYPGIHFGGIEVAERAIHETADGRRMLVVHGDEFDMVVLNHRWLAHLGDIAYGLAMWANKWHNRTRNLFGMRYWSFSRWAKLKVKRAVSFISDFEEVLADEARKAGADGVICGHIHHAANEMMNGVRYINTGDWVESCTAVVEHEDGRFEVIDWSRRIVERAMRPRLAASQEQLTRGEAA